MQGEASTRLGFTDYFRVELAWAKLLGAVLLLAPVPARLKEWAYAAFAITLGSALIAHLSIGEGPRRRGAGRRARHASVGNGWTAAGPFTAIATCLNGSFESSPAVMATTCRSMAHHVTSA